MKMVRCGRVGLHAKPSDLSRVGEPVGGQSLALLGVGQPGGGDKTQPHISPPGCRSPSVHVLDSVRYLSETATFSTVAFPADLNLGYTTLLRFLLHSGRLSLLVSH